MDIQTLYPTQSDIYDKMEISEPEYYNYMCVHGYQLFLRRKKRERIYEVITAGWCPVSEYSKTTSLDRYHVLYSCAKFNDAYRHFRRIGREMLAWQIDLFDGEY